LAPARKKGTFSLYKKKRKGILFFPAGGREKPFLPWKCTRKKKKKTLFGGGRGKANAFTRKKASLSCNLVVSGRGLALFNRKKKDEEGGGLDLTSTKKEEATRRAKNSFVWTIGKEKRKPSSFPKKGKKKKRKEPLLLVRGNEGGFYTAGGGGALDFRQKEGKRRASMHELTEKKGYECSCRIGL